MPSKIAVYQLRSKFVDQREDVPEDARQVVYYTMAVGHHVGIMDCFSSQLEVPMEEYAAWVQTLPEGPARTNFVFPRYMDPFAFFQKYNTSETGDAKIYTIIGDELRCWPVDTSNTVQLWYYKRLSALSSATNTLFTTHPDLYLYASLAAAAPFLKDDKRVALWEGEYKSVRDSVNRNERQGRYGNSLRVVNS